MKHILGHIWTRHYNLGTGLKLGSCHANTGSLARHSI